MAQTNNLWSNLLLAATKQPRHLAGLLGIGDPQSYLTEKEQQQAEDVRNWGIQAVADVTSPFAKGANILAQGYGDLYRGLSGNTDYVSPLESYIKSGISQESHQKIQDNPYKEILKSGAGMAATLAPMSTGGVFTNAATRGTRAFSGLNPSANPLVNQLSQIVARGGFEGLLGGYGQSREGKELQDSLLGMGLGIAGEGVGEYLTNKNFRQLLNENVSRGYKMATSRPGTPMKYSDLLNGDVTVSANNYSGLLDQAKEEIDPISYSQLREALDRGQISTDEFIRYTGDPEQLFTNTSVSNPEIIGGDDLPDIPVYEDGDQAYSDLLKGQRKLSEGGDGGRVLDNIQKEIENISNAPATEQGLKRLQEIKKLYGDKLTGAIDMPLRIYEESLNPNVMGMSELQGTQSDALQDILDTYRDRGFLPKNPDDMLDGTVRQPDLVQEAKKYKSADDFIKSQGKILYHGTPDGSFETFDNKFKGTRSNHNPEDVGFHFTDNKEIAASYSGEYLDEHIAKARSMGIEPTALIKERGKNPKTIEAVLDIKNPLKIGKSRDINSKTIQEAISGGYDGIIANYGDGLEYVVFSPDQIKTKSQLTDFWKRATGK